MSIRKDMAKWETKVMSTLILLTERKILIPQINGADTAVRSGYVLDEMKSKTF